jgi:hypothetical protein
MQCSNKQKLITRRVGGKQSKNFRREKEEVFVLKWNPNDRIIADSTRTTLRFWLSLAVTANSSTPAPAYRFKPTAAYDVDPNVASTATPGFSEMAAFYLSYRVKGSRIKVQVVNQSSTAGELIVVPLNLDPGAAILPNTVISWKSNPYSKFNMISTAGGPVTTVSQQMTTRKIYGNKMTDYDDNFSSPTSSTPVNNWFWAIGVYTMATTTSTFLLDLCIDMDVEFFDRRYLTI